MKKTLAIILLSLCVVTLPAQHKKRPHFDPERFQADLEQFIVRQAALLPGEAEVFFPVFREMQKEQRIIFEQQRRHRHIKPANEAGCRNAIIENDEMDLRIKELQMKYHKKFLTILPATKVYDILKAEDRFHREAFRRAAENGPWQQGKRATDKKSRASQAKP